MPTSPQRSARLAATTRFIALACLICGGHASAQQASAECAPVAIPGHYGPYDYVTQYGALRIVEQHHFGPRVEALVSGRDGTLGGDISYTLNASPNHHKALVALMRLGLRSRSAQPPNVHFPIDCYFDRALRFRQEDTVVRTIFALWLGKTERMPQALASLQTASELAKDNPFSQMNIGLVYLELGQTELAQKQARLAEELGLEPTPLKQKLQATGK